MTWIRRTVKIIYELMVFLRWKMKILRMPWLKLHLRSSWLFCNVSRVRSTVYGKIKPIICNFTNSGLVSDFVKAARIIKPTSRPTLTAIGFQQSELIYFSLQFIHLHQWTPYSGKEAAILQSIKFQNWQQIWIFVDKRWKNIFKEGYGCHGDWGESEY